MPPTSPADASNPSSINPWSLPPPTLPSLFVEPALLASLIASGAASPADAALLVRVGELARSLDTATAVARAQWAGWCVQKVRANGEREEETKTPSFVFFATRHFVRFANPFDLAPPCASLPSSASPLATPPPYPHPPPPPSTPPSPTQTRPCAPRRRKWRARARGWRQPPGPSPPGRAPARRPARCAPSWPRARTRRGLSVRVAAVRRRGCCRWRPRSRPPPLPPSAPRPRPKTRQPAAWRQRPVRGGRVAWRVGRQRLRRLAQAQRCRAPRRHRPPRRPPRPNTAPSAAARSPARAAARTGAGPAPPPRPHPAGPGKQQQPRRPPPPPRAAPSPPRRATGRATGEGPGGERPGLAPLAATRPPPPRRSPAPHAARRLRH